MHKPLSSSQRHLSAWLAACALLTLGACSASSNHVTAEPGFGQTYRQALQSQTQTPTPAAQAARVPYTELEPALDRQLKAKPLETTQNRSTLGGSSLFGQ